MVLLKYVLSSKDHKISSDLIINFDRTAINYVPVSSWTLEKEGSQSDKIKGALACTLSKYFLCTYIKEKTSRCLPNCMFPKN